MKIPITKPYFDQRERELLVQPLDTGWVVQGPFVFSTTIFDKRHFE